MATQTFGEWFAEQLKGLVLTLIMMPLALGGLYAVFRRAPRTWWIWGTGVVLAFMVFGMLIGPVYIQPLFNTYKPITDPAISEPILELARENNIPVTQVFEVDASRQTKRISANVAGFLGTTRIALNDNLLTQCTLPEIRHVMGHEMGHYVLNHTGKLLLMFGSLFLVSFAAARVSFGFALKRWGDRWGVRGIADPAGLPLLMLIFATVLFVLTPVTKSVTRMVESQADAFALDKAREPDAAAAVALKLGSYRKLDPGPLEEFVFFDHPSGRARIRMAMEWKAAQQANQ
jgi:STE24 endopeptidase